MSSEIADRHLIPVEGLQTAAAAAPAFVRVRVDAGWAEAVGGQLLTSCLVNLLCRQVKLIHHIEIVAPTAPLMIALPSGPTGADFPQCLGDLAAWAVKDAVTVSMTETSDTADQEIMVGMVGPCPGEGRTFVALGDSWRAWVGLPSNAPAGVRPISTNPLGPFLAAAFAAGEVFKRTCGITRGRFLKGNGYSLWSGETAQNWASLPEGPDVAGKAIEPIHMVGAGAVGNGLAYILANAKLESAYMVALDDDIYDAKNLNRCLGAGWKDLDNPKVDAIARLLKAGGIDTLPFPGTIKSYLSDPRHGLRFDVARSVRNLDFGIVASCVDKGISRQDVQSLRPSVLVGGSTLDLQARANIYNLRPDAACLACHNPAERNGDAIRKLERELKAMSRADRAQALRSFGLDPDAVEAYFTGVECGGVGEISLKAFATKPPALFSVGFVSLGAALLLASVLLRNTIFAETAPSRADMTILNFLNGGLMDAGLGFDLKCEWGCRKKLQSI